MTTPRADIMIVDDTPENLRVLAGMLGKQGYRTRPLPSGSLALAAARSEPPDLILLDINMPGMSGYEVCHQLKTDDRLKHIPVIFISALGETEDKLRAFAAGGVDYISKPFQFPEVEARISTHLKLRQLRQDLERHNHHLSELVAEQVKDISDAQHATIFALAKLAEARDRDTGAHLLRVRRYCRALASHLAGRNTFPRQIDAAFIDLLEWASPLHDIGKVCIPDTILLKHAPLTPEEWAVMRTHTTLGATTLESVLVSYPRNPLVRMGCEIARSHHERWSGGGYPQGLAGEAIPLPARIFKIADHYDALRSTRPYKPPLSHAETVRIFTEGDDRTRPDHFDPRVLAAFREIETVFAGIWQSPESASAMSS
jgi:putative two-component system response regulator